MLGKTIDYSNVKQGEQISDAYVADGEIAGNADFPACRPCRRDKPRSRRRLAIAKWICNGLWRKVSPFGGMTRMMPASGYPFGLGSLDQRVRLALICLLIAGPVVFQPVQAEPTRLLESDQKPLLDGSTLVLNGIGIRNFLFFDFYEIALYLPHRLGDANSALKNEVPRRVRITLLREVVAERDLEFLMAGLKENNTPEELAAIQIPLDQFKSMIRAMGKVAKGSVVYMDYVPHLGTQIWLNRRLLGTVQGSAFNRSVLKIWLGERPIQKNLKKALLGGAS